MPTLYLEGRIAYTLVPCLATPQLALAMNSFEAELKIIGINPYVEVTLEVLEEVFAQAGRSKGQIPIRGLLNGAPYQQTLVRYAGQWRLYVNTTMLKNSPKRIGERVTISVCYDEAPRQVLVPVAFTEALAQNEAARQRFMTLSPSHQKEITRYLANLKSTDVLHRNIRRAISYLVGEGSFVGRGQGQG